MIIIKIKQYGLINSFKRLIYSLLRKFNIYYESIYFMAFKSIKNDIISKMNKYDYSDVKTLNLSDFRKGDPSIFTKNKLEQIKNRLNSGNYVSFGIISKNRLVYSCWVCKSSIILPNSKIIKLKANEGLLEDAYCHQDFRGQGYHSKMNLYRIRFLINEGRFKIYVLVISENTPAFKSQIKSGFIINKKMFFLKIFGKQFFKEILINKI